MTAELAPAIGRARRKSRRARPAPVAVPRVVVVATLLLVPIVVALIHAGRVPPPPAASSPAVLAAATDDVPAPTLFEGGAVGRSVSVGATGSSNDVSQDEYDDRLALGLALLDPAKPRDVERFLEQNGSPARNAPAAAQSRLIAGLYRMRGNEDPRVRAAALAALGRLPSGHFILTEAFVGAFSDPDARVRREAVIGRTRHGVEDYGPYVVRLAEDPDAGVRAATAVALGGLTGEDAEAALLRLLDDAVDDVVVAAADIVGRRIGDLPTDPMFRLVRSKRGRVRVAGVALLGILGTDESRAQVVTLLDDPAWEVRRAASRSLVVANAACAAIVRQRAETAAFDAGRPRRERFEALQQLSRVEGTPGADPVQAIAESDADPALRLAAARCLLARGDSRACAVLVSLLETGLSPSCDAADRAFVRSAAARTLRDVSGAEFFDDDIRAWTSIVPSLAKRVLDAEFAYEPEYLSETW